ncbi:hypothetical protein [Ensifer sp. SL37]|nr:hypothetical protein [Ensifer sp. SL37]MCY1740658.1 hypothetical protein [Ensifer sp. SL37]
MKKFLLLTTAFFTISAAAANVALAGEEVCIESGNAQVCLIYPE